jgi:hypothetical protein
MVLAVALALVAAGAGIEIYHYEHPNPPPAAVTVTVVLGDPAFRGLVCNVFEVPVYYVISFNVMSFSAPVTTAQFGVGVVNALSSIVPANTTAPAAQSTLPCGEEDPDGWYAEYTDGPSGPWATFPYYGNSWSTGGSAPITLSTQGWFDLISGSDLSGTEDNITAFGVGGSHVSFTGNTTFPPFHGP